jgi:hypothetical protein
MTVSLTESRTHGPETHNAPLEGRPPGARRVANWPWSPKTKASPPSAITHPKSNGFAVPQEPAARGDLFPLTVPGAHIATPRHKAVNHPFGYDSVHATTPPGETSRA